MGSLPGDLRTGLSQLRQRWYDTPQREAESGPIGFTVGLNLYGYVGQNPVNLVDPEGLAGPKEFCTAFKVLKWTNMPVQPLLPQSTLGIGDLALIAAGEFGAPLLAVGFAGWALSQRAPSRTPCPQSNLGQLFRDIPKQTRQFTIYPGSRHWRSAGVSPNDAHPKYRQQQECYN